MTQRKKNIRPHPRLSEGLKQLEQAILSSPSPEEVLKKLLKIVHSSLGKILTYDKQEKMSHHDIDPLHFQELVESLNDWIWKVDEFGVYTYVSPRIKDLLGYEPEEVIGKRPFDLMPQEEAERVSRLFEELVKKRQPFYALENTNRTRGGDLIVLETSGVPIIDNQGRFHGYQGVDRDITKRKSNEMALVAATQAAESASQTKDLFLAKVSHEIRTPLTTIIGFGELLEDTDLTPEQKKYLAAINSSGSTLASLIDDVLDLSKVEAGKLALNLKDFSLHALISKLVATQAQQIEEKGLQVNISIDPDIPDLLIGDSLRIQQVFLNLFCNAIKFTEKGEINISAAVVEKTGLRVLLEIAVEDTGIGISADLQERIFEPFAQISNPSRPNCVGSGLGLTISRSLADLMGGSIRVESREGVGSIFHFLVPLQIKIDPLSDKSLITERKSSLWSGQVLNILLAEDDTVNAGLIKIALQNMGHTVTVAENGKVALDTLKANTFDVVLMDIQMPVMNGTDVLKVIREQEKTTGKNLIMIALTANALVGDKEKYMKMGFDGYLSKPFRTNELIDEMIRVMPI